MWTLWLLTFAGGTGSATPAMNPLATYSTQVECYQGINAIVDSLKKVYGDNYPAIGALFCVPGTLPKR